MKLKPKTLEAWAALCPVRGPAQAPFVRAKRIRRSEPRDHIYLGVLIGFMRSIREDGFVAFLNNFTGLSWSETNRYLQRYLRNTESLHSV